MILIKALETGFPVRRKDSAIHKGSHGDGWLGNDYIKEMLAVFVSMGNTTEILTREDISADDWEYLTGSALKKDRENLEAIKQKKAQEL